MRSTSVGPGRPVEHVPAARGAAGARIEIDVRGKIRPAMAAASYPEDLLYHAEHDWARIEPDPTHPHATLGVTWYAQDALGEVVFCEPPAVGTALRQGEPYAEVESVKAVSDVIAPLSGEVVAVNDALAEEPERINDDPYGEGWLVKVRLSDPSEAEALLDADAYVASLV